jgi:hypothetical protein
MKKFTIILMLALLFGTVQAGNRFGDVYHEIQIVDENGEKVDDITNLFIYLAGTTTDATIYMDEARQNTITIPMTEASTNTTLTDGKVFWWGPDKYDFSMTNGDGVGPRTNSGHRDRASNEGEIQFPSYLQSISSTNYTDAQTITMGTGADWVFQAGNVANRLSFTPAADDSTFNIGVSGTGLNSNFNVFNGTALGFKLSSAGATHSLTYDGGIVNLNPSSNFATNICTGTSTGATTIGNSAGGAIALDTDTSITVNADDSYALTVSAGAVTIAAAGASAGDVTLTAADIMSFISTDTKLFNGAAAETWIVEGTADDHEATIVFTDPTADVTWTFPTAAADTFAVMASTLATNAPEIVNSVSGGTNQLIYEGTADASECILTAADATADVIYTLPDAAAATYGIMPSSLATNAVDIANSVTGGTSQLVFEGATADTEESIIQATDPTADIIWILPDGAADSFAFVGSTLTTNIAEAANSFWGGTNQIIMEGATADAFETIITPNDATADATIELPDDSGDIVYAPSGVVDYAAGAGALPITHTIITYESTGGAEALTLADGQPGQILSVNHDTDGGNGVITPATALGYTSIDLADDGDMVTFQFVDTQGWIIIGTAGNAAPPVVTP